jgi:tRNA(Ile2) C34 agmatinyltransferase TiaS
LSDLVTRPMTPEYERGCEAMGWVRTERHCETCGRLPVWCECDGRLYGYTCRRCKNPARPEQLVKVDGEHEHAVQCPTYVAVQVNP